MQTLLDKAHQPYRDHNRDNVTLIADQRNFIQSTEYRLHGLNAVCCDRPCVLQVGVNHNHTDNRTEVGVTAEYLGCRVRNQDGQEGVRRVGKQRCKHIDRTAGINVCKTVVVHKVQGIHDTHEEARSNDCRDDGNEDIAQGLDEPLEPVALLCCGSLDVFLAACRDAALLDESVKHLVYNACAEDDL